MLAKNNMMFLTFKQTNHKEGVVMAPLVQLPVGEYDTTPALTFSPALF